MLSQLGGEDQRRPVLIRLVITIPLYHLVSGIVVSQILTPLVVKAAGLLPVIRRRCYRNRGRGPALAGTNTSTANGFKSAFVFGIRKMSRNHGKIECKSAIPSTKFDLITRSRRSARRSDCSKRR